VVSRDALLARVALSQYGIFTIAQAMRCGFSGAAIRGRAARGVYDRVHLGVYRIGGTHTTFRGEVIAAEFSMPSMAAASHHTAAFLWDMTSIQPDVVEVVTRRHRRILVDPFVVHESKDLIEADIISLDGIRATTAVRTIVDLGASVSPRFVEHCLDTSLRKGLFDAWDVRRFIARVARSGRNGVGTIRPLIMERLEWDGITESALEDRFRSLLASSGIELPIPQFEVFDRSGAFVCRADFAYPERSVLIELDSEQFHMDPSAFRADREKQNRAQQLGWTVYRFTWRQIADDPSAVLRILAYVTQH
jgi:putative AbiEi antitoxin of type IV toxin-antitoxin system